MLFDLHNKMNQQIADGISREYASTIMSYIPDNKKKWAANHHKEVVLDIKSFSKFIPYGWLTDIGQCMRDFVGKDIFNHNQFMECMIAIEELKSKYCTKCKKMQKLYLFEGVFETCRPCRDNGRIKRFEKKITDAIWYFNANGGLYHTFKVSNTHYTIACIAEMIKKHDLGIHISNWTRTKKFYRITIRKRINFT
jgi:hypothetical protein